jgi:predicted nucleotidyltransferase
MASEESDSHSNAAHHVVHATVRDVVLAEPAIVAAYVFGSVARGTAGPLSDVDVALLIQERHQRHSICDRTTDALCRRLHTSRVDVVLLTDATVPLRYRVVRDGRLLINRDPRVLERFIAQTVLEYLDFQPVRERAFGYMSDAILERH